MGSDNGISRDTWHLFYFRHKFSNEKPVRPSRSKLNKSHDSLLMPPNIRQSTMVANGDAAVDNGDCCDAVRMRAQSTRKQSYAKYFSANDMSPSAISYAGNPKGQCWGMKCGWWLWLEFHAQDASWVINTMGGTQSLNWRIWLPFFLPPHELFTLFTFLLMQTS